MSQYALRRPWNGIEAVPVLSLTAAPPPDSAEDPGPPMDVIAPRCNGAGSIEQRRVQVESTVIILLAIKTLMITGVVVLSSQGQVCTALPRRGNRSSASLMARRSWWLSEPRGSEYKLSKEQGFKLKALLYPFHNQNLKPGGFNRVVSSQGQVCTALPRGRRAGATRVSTAL